MKKEESPHPEFGCSRHPACAVFLSGLNLTPSKIFADIYFIQPFPLTSFDELRQTDPGGGAHHIFGAVQNTRRFIKQEHVEKRARTGIVEEFSLNVDCIQLKMAED